MSNTHRPSSDRYVPRLLATLTPWALLVFVVVANGCADPDVPILHSQLDKLRQENTELRTQLEQAKSDLAGQLQQVKVLATSATGEQATRETAMKGRLHKLEQRAGKVEGTLQHVRKIADGLLERERAEDASDGKKAEEQSARLASLIDALQKRVALLESRLEGDTSATRSDADAATGDRDGNPSRADAGRVDASFSNAAD